MDRWEYLISKEYLLRHHIAEYFLSDVSFIIDVGAYKRTIGGAYPYNVIPIDPLKTMVDSYHGTVSAWVNEHGDLLDDNFGVMALGLEIEGEKDEWDSFFKIVEESKITIIEHSIEHQPSVDQFELIMKNTKKTLVASIDMKFCHVDTPGFIPHSTRRLVVLQ